MDILIKDYKLIKLINQIIKLQNVEEVVSIRKTDFVFVINAIGIHNEHITYEVSISDFEEW